MGERVDLGGVVYTVLEAAWRSSIGEGLGAMVPKDRFLVLRISVTNGLGAQISVPFLTLEGRQEPVMEVQDVKNLPRWMGVIRMVSPAQTEDGLIVFDVPPAAYKLRVSAIKDDEDITRLVEIPLTLEESRDVPVKAP
jgi:hypothetical protein